MLFQYESTAPLPPSKAQVEKRLVNAKASAGYRPGAPLHFFYGYGNQLPPLGIFYSELEVMLLHPNVQIALSYYKSGLASAEFEVHSKNTKVKQFVHELYTRIWQHSLGNIQESYDYGWIGAEIIYRFNDDGLLDFDSLKTFHPRDTKPLTQDHQFAGLRVRNVKGNNGPLDLWSAQSGLAKGFWHAHRAKFGSLIGWSQALPSWRPWRRLAMQDGGEDVIDMAVYRFGVKGPVCYFPPGQPNVEDGQGEPGNPSNGDVARNIAEMYKAGGSASMPSVFDDKGNPLWKLDIPDYVLNVDSLVNYNKSLADQISLGIGVPPELLQAAETGSGYSGRQIPLEAFYEGQQEIARSIVFSIREQIARPLVKWNFGEENANFDIEVKPLLQTRAKRQMVGQQSGQLDAITGLPSGVTRSTLSPFQGLSTTWDESEHPRDDDGEFATKMTSGEWDKHLRSTGRRGAYGPGVGGLKLAHRTHVEDALRSGKFVPDHVRNEYPDLSKQYPEVSRRKEMAQSRVSEREKWLQEAQEQGLDPKHVKALAKELLTQNKEYVTQHNQMLKRARSGLDKYGGAHRLIAAKSKTGKGEIEDVSHLRGLDDVARTVAGEFPGFFGRDTGYHGDADFIQSDDELETAPKLLELLKAGNLAPMAEEEAYAQATSQLLEMKDSGSFDDMPDFSLQPWQMNKRDFLEQHTALRKSLESIHRKAGFIGNPQPDRANSREERDRLAQVIGYKPGTNEYLDVIKWPLHKLHVAAAVKSGQEVPEHVLAEYPKLTFLATAGDDDVPLGPGARDRDTFPIVNDALTTLNPIHAQVVRQILSVLQNRPINESWPIVRALLAQYRNDAIQSLVIARISSALAAMRRVAENTLADDSPQSINSQGLPTLPRAALPSESANITPVVSDVLGLAEGEEPISSLSMIENAVQDLISRKVLTPEKFYGLASQARQDAFTVAGELPEASLNTIRESLSEAVAKGLDQREWRDSVEQALGSDPFLSPAHRETVFRANVYQAYTNGTNEILKHPMLEDAYPYRMIFEIDDSRGRDWHRALNRLGLDGTNVYRADDPVWDVICPPSDYGCRGGWTPCTVEQAANAGVREAQEWLRTGEPPANPGRAKLPANWHQSPMWQHA